MTLKLNGSTSGSVSIDAPASTTSGADITFKLPVADGTNGQALVTNASGQLSFATAGEANPCGTGLFRAHVSSAISIANNAYADPVIWQTEDYDLEGWYNTTTGKYTPQVAGYYKIETHILMSNFGSTWAEVWVKHRKNGTDYAESVFNSPQGGGYEGGVTSTIVLMNGSTDYWTCRVLNQNGDGGSDNILASTNYNWVHGYLLKAT